MIIDNRFRTAQYRMAFVILMGLIAILTIYIIFEKYYFKYYAAGAIIIIAAIYIILHLKKPYYFYFNDQGNKIVLRYYFAHPIKRKYKAIEVQKKYLAGYQIKSKLGGLSKYLILKVQSNKGTGNYPPISLGGLSTIEIKNLEKSINKIIRSKK